jgi:excisionase family DNA binding protein
MSNNEKMRLVGLEAASEILGLRPNTIRLWAKAKKIETVKLGRRRLISIDEIQRVIDENRCPRKACD